MHDYHMVCYVVLLWYRAAAGFNIVYIEHLGMVIGHGYQIKSQPASIAKPCQTLCITSQTGKLTGAWRLL